MALSLFVKNIRCPNCSYEGKARIKGTGCGLWLLFLAVFLISFIFWPLFLVAGLMFVWLLLKPADQICPKCKHPHPVIEGISHPSAQVFIGLVVLLISYWLVPTIQLPWDHQNPRTEKSPSPPTTNKINENRAIDQPDQQELEPKENKEINAQIEAKKDADTPTIPGIRSVDVLVNFRNRGFKVSGPIERVDFHGKEVEWTCEEDKADHKYVAEIIGETSDRITMITASSIAYFIEDADSIAKEFLGFASSVAYDGSTPDSAKEWVLQNIGDGSSPLKKSLDRHVIISDA